MCKAVCYQNMQTRARRRATGPVLYTQAHAGKGRAYHEQHVRAGMSKGTEK